MADVEALDFSLRALAVQEGDRQAPSRVEALLMAEFRRERAARSRRRIRWQIAALGTAAALILGIGISLHHRALPDSNGGLAPAIAAGSTSNPGNTAASASSQQSLSSDADLNAGDSEYATAFVPLPYADDPTAANGGTVVRVVLSRSALASFGLPVTDMGETDRIPADIVLSEDGAPQAIRLVSQSNLDE
jgi:hypothetical protein